MTVSSCLRVSCGTIAIGSHSRCGAGKEIRLIRQSQQRACRAVNAELVDLYWRVGEYISRKLRSAEWGDGVVAQLAQCIQFHYPNVRGFTRASPFRMRQYCETYCADRKVASLLRQLPWTHHLMILGRSRFPEERQFYMRMAIREHWRSRELDRQIRAAFFEPATLTLSIPRLNGFLGQFG